MDTRPMHDAAEKIRETTRRFRSEEKTNLSATEQGISLLVGGALTAGGLRRRGAGGLAAAAVGGMLLERGLRGRCRLYEALGLSSTGGALHASKTSPDPEHALHVKQTTSILRSPDELYQAWRDFTTLPDYMDHLESVEVLTHTRSRWVAKGPAGTRIEWEAEITIDSPGQEIAWRTVAPAEVPHAGSVRFKAGPEGRGTVVEVEMSYDPPAGRAGRAVATLLGRSPEQEVRTALQRFRQKMETGHIPTTEGQPRGSR